MKIVVFEAESRERPALAPLAADHELVFSEAALCSDNAARFADAEVVSPFVYSTLDEAALMQLPALRLIATRSTGFDHIDAAYCERRGIMVCNVPSYGANTVAEHTFALLLAVSHRLPEAFERARRGPFSPSGLEGFDLAGQTLGVVGTGSIGRHVVRIGTGLAMHVIATDPVERKGLSGYAGFRYVPLDELLATADVISLHLPSTAGTRNLLSREAFARMKDGVVIINTARGDLIDSRALIHALGTGKVAGAGLDVLPDEPLIREEAELICSAFGQEFDLTQLVADHVLLRLPNVVVTPHSAFNTRQAVARILSTTVRNIDGYLTGRPENVVVEPQPPARDGR